MDEQAISVFPWYYRKSWIFDYIFGYDQETGRLEQKQKFYEIEFMDV